MISKIAMHSRLLQYNQIFASIKSFSKLCAYLLLILAFFFPEYDYKGITFLDIVTVFLGCVVFADFFLRSSFQLKIVDIYVLLFLFVSASVIASNNTFFDFLLAIRCVQAAVVYLFFRTYFLKIKQSEFLMFSTLVLSLIDMSFFAHQLYVGYKGYYGYSLLGFYYPLQQLYFALFMLFVLINFDSLASAKRKFTKPLLYSAISFYFLILFFVGSKIGFTFSVFIGIYILSVCKNKVWRPILISYLLSVALFLMLQVSPFYKKHTAEVEFIISEVATDQGLYQPNPEVATDQGLYQPNPEVATDQGLYQPNPEVVRTERNTIENIINRFERFKIDRVLKSIVSRYSISSGKTCSAMGNNILNYDSELLLRYCKGGIFFLVISIVAFIFLFLILGIPFPLAMPVIISLLTHEVLFVGLSSFVLFFGLGSFVSLKVLEPREA